MTKTRSTLIKKPAKRIPDTRKPSGPTNARSCFSLARFSLTELSLTGCSLAALCFLMTLAIFQSNIALAQQLDEAAIRECNIQRYQELEANTPGGFDFAKEKRDELFRSFGDVCRTEAIEALTQQDRDQQIEQAHSLASAASIGANLGGLAASLSDIPQPPTPSVLSPPIIFCCGGCIIERCVNDWDCTFCENAGKFGIYGIQLLVYQQLVSLRSYLRDTIWAGNIQPLIGAMTTQIFAVGFSQTAMIGTFFDAKNQSNRQLVLDQHYVDAVRTYQPSPSLCRFGSASIGLASSEQLANINTSLMAEHSLARNLGREGTPAEKAQDDLSVRVSEFRSIYCDPTHAGGRLVDQLTPNGNVREEGVCGPGGDPGRVNRDIDVAGAFFSPATLNVNFTNQTRTEGEEDLLALAHNLYGYGLKDGPNNRALQENEPDFEKNRIAYHSYRALLAKRTVAQNSFYTLAGLKSEGSGASTQSLIQIITQLGFSPEDAANLLSAAPSYDAQLEILSKTLYQNPQFLTALVENPQNVKRQQAAMLAIELMQRRESYKAMRRQEMILASMLDLFSDRRFQEAKAKLEDVANLQR